MTEWIKAKGDCGFALGGRAVEAAYVNGVALFVFKSNLSKPESEFYSCVITGHCTRGGVLQAQAKRLGIEWAEKYGTAMSDRKLSRAQFDEIVNREGDIEPCAPA